MWSFLTLIVISSISPEVLTLHILLLPLQSPPVVYRNSSCRERTRCVEDNSTPLVSEYTFPRPYHPRHSSLRATTRLEHLRTDSAAAAAAPSMQNICL